MNLSDNEVSSDEVRFLLTDCYYSIEDSGHVGKKPYVHLCGRSETGERVHRVVTDFRPAFYITHEEFVQKRDVIEAEMDSAAPAIIDHSFGYEGIDPRSGEARECVKLVCEVPSDVKKQREHFDQTFEADVLFADRFCATKDITDGIAVPKGQTEISHTDVEPTDVNVEPRYCAFDIEVFTNGEGIPDVELAQKPVTAITLYDSYTEVYWTGVLEHTMWNDVDRRDTLAVYDDRDRTVVEIEGSDGDTEVVYDSVNCTGQCTVYRDEQELVYDAIEQIRGWSSDVLTGWNSDLFDVPYMVNRALELRCGNVETLSPTGDVRRIENPPRATNWCLKGIQCWDALTAFKKMQIHDLKSYSLEHAATEVLGFGKEEMGDIDTAWKRNPAQFTHYNVRDTEAVVGIVEKEGLVDAYTNIQALTGTRMGDAHHNKKIVDNTFVRLAQNWEEA